MNIFPWDSESNVLARAPGARLRVLVDGSLKLGKNDGPHQRTQKGQNCLGVMSSKESEVSEK